ncbi:MaoC family dehydratase [Halomarina litorea]|uniref:MaoC family dehydratase n=1 Tax=Halomarina litorea TaxID=2961595 RepID=UPI0020C5AF6E|nr:MaoC family dehydratase [Halomarina sp. BCD28]
MSHDQTYEDVTVGETRSFGEYEVTREEILRFAGQYDPQPFHVDEEAAESSMFGGLVASGWHTAAMTMRMLVDGELNESGALGAVGVDELRWPNPVRPGDTLSIETEVLEKEPFREGIGLVHSRTVTTNDDGETVMSMVGRVLFPMG